MNNNEQLHIILLHVWEIIELFCSFRLFNVEKTWFAIVHLQVNYREQFENITEESQSLCISSGKVSMFEEKTHMCRNLFLKLWSSQLVRKFCLRVVSAVGDLSYDHNGDISHLTKLPLRSNSSLVLRCFTTDLKKRPLALLLLLPLQAAAQYCRASLNGPTSCTFSILVSQQGCFLRKRYVRQQYGLTDTDVWLSGCIHVYILNSNCNYSVYIVCRIESMFKNILFVKRKYRIYFHR